MSDYVLTTDDVRDLVTMPWHEPADYDYEHEVARFNTWLASVERAAAEKAWDACLDEAAKQGTIQEPDNPYRQERKDDAIREV